MVKYIEQHFELEQDFLCTIRKKAVLWLNLNNPLSFIRTRNNQLVVDVLLTAIAIKKWVNIFKSHVTARCYREPLKNASESKQRAVKKAEKHGCTVLFGLF